MDAIGGAEAGCDTTNELSFPGAEIAFEAYNHAGASAFTEGAAKRDCLFRACRNVCSHERRVV